MGRIFASANRSVTSASFCARSAANSISFFRVSGYVNSWRRVNLPFLNALRKHFLIWRTYSPEQRQEYAVRGYEHFRDVFDAVGWPAPEGAETADLAPVPAQGAAPAGGAAPQPQQA